MRLFIYCVFDSCSGVYDRPWCAQADGVAIRSFGDIAGDADHPIGKHPEFFSLFRVGTFDDNTGDLAPELPVCIGKAHELVAAVRKVAPGNLELFDDNLKSNGDDTHAT